MFVALALPGAGTALAQGAPDEEPQIEVEIPPPPLPPGEPEPIPEPDVPEDPMAQVPREPEVTAPVVRYGKQDYPVEIVRRPLTLAADQVEAGLAVPLHANDGHPTMTQVLTGAFGATVDLEVGLTYAVGLERLDAQAGEDSFVVGRAFSVDAAYTLIPRFLAAQARFAFYVHPDLFAAGLILGLPFKITIQDRWALYGGADLVHIKLKGFAVDPADPGAGEAARADADRGVAADAGSVDVRAGFVFQAKENVALNAEGGVTLPDFDTADQAASLFVGATVSPRPIFDLGARLGFADLADPGASFAATIFAALRL